MPANSLETVCSRCQVDDASSGDATGRFDPQAAADFSINLNELTLSASPALLDSEATIETSGASTQGSNSSRPLSAARFRPLRPHAKGGLGVVFVALDAELNREVALKQILEQHADDPTSRARFILEAEITGGLEHPGIVPVYGLGVHDNGRPYYAMRFIRGYSLKEAIAKFHAPAAANEELQSNGVQAGSARPGCLGSSRDLELRKLLRRFLDVCNALDYAHARGVLHRDVKPANIVVGNHGETLVVDNR